MAKSSINFKPVKGNSEAHNLRETPLDYTLGADLTATNESWVDDKIRSRQSDIEAHCRNVSGRKMNKNATPIREAVVNLNANHSLADCRRLEDALRDKFKIDCFQIHLHRDEGKDRENLNYHAHMVFDWQDKISGKMLRLNKLAMSQIQTLVADSLEMERGKEGSKAVRLEAQAYKATKECEAQEAKAEALRQECAKLEQGNKAVTAEIEKKGAEVAALERKKQRLLQALLKRCQEKWQIWKNRFKAPEKLTELYNQTMARVVGDMEKETQSEIDKGQKNIDQAEQDHQNETPGENPAGWFKQTFRSRELAREGEMIAEREQAHKEKQRERQQNIDKLTKHHIPQKQINDRMKEIDPALYQAQEQIARDNKMAEREQVRARRRSPGQSQDNGLEL